MWSSELQHLYVVYSLYIVKTNTQSVAFLIPFNLRNDLVGWFEVWVCSAGMWCQEGHLAIISEPNSKSIKFSYGNPWWDKPQDTHILAIFLHILYKCSSFFPAHFPSLLFTLSYWPPPLTYLVAPFKVFLQVASPYAHRSAYAFYFALVFCFPVRIVSCYSALCF